MLVSSSCLTPQAMVRNWANPQAVSGVHYVEAMKALVIYVYAGELLLFDGGRYFHKVSPVEGSRARWTIGGFVGFTRDHERVVYWS